MMITDPQKALDAMINKEILGFEGNSEKLIFQLENGQVHVMGNNLDMMVYIEEEGMQQDS